MKFFLSFTPQDKFFADQLSEALKKMGIEPVSIDLQITYGKDLDRRILQGSPGFDYVIILLSKSHAQSEWLQNEMLAFIALERSRGTKIIFPIIIEDCEVPLFFGDRQVVDFRGASVEEATRQLVSYISVSQKAFVAMKFGDDDLDAAYLGAIKPVLENFKYNVIRIDEVQNSGKITEQISNEILGSAIVLADLTGERPNCYYEAGYAHASGKTVILTVRENTPIHFDLASYRFIVWKNVRDLRNQLTERIEAIRRGNI